MTSSGMDRRRVLGLAGLGAAGAGFAACSKSGSGAGWNAGGSPGASNPPPPPAPSPSTRDGLRLGSGKPVHVRLYQSDGATYGVGLPIIAYLSTTITDSHTFIGASKVKVNGTPA